MARYSEYSDMLIAKDEEQILMHIAPTEFIDKHLSGSVNKLKRDFLINFLQDELRNVLQSFLNGGMSRAGYVTYPLIQPISLEIKEKLSRLFIVARVLGGKRNTTKEKPQSVSECASAIGSLYRDFEKVRTLGKHAVKLPLCGLVDMGIYSKEHAKYMRPLAGIVKIAESMGNDCVGMYLHGSLATNDFVKGWSDCDTLCVVSKQAIENENRLIALRSKLIGMRKLFYQIDPLQHHGCMIMSEYDLSSYPQNYFPLQLFGYARSFGKRKIDEVILRDDTRGSYARLFWSVSFFRKLHEEKRYSMGSYETKNLLHQIALFPSLYLQAKRIYVYKKFSFEKAKKNFSKELWRPIDEMTSIRNRWRQMPMFPLIRSYANINPFVAYQANARLIDMTGSIGKININVKKLVDGMYNLSEEAWKKVRPLP